MPTSSKPSSALPASASSWIHVGPRFLIVVQGLQSCLWISGTLNASQACSLTLPFLPAHGATFLLN